MHWCLLLSNIEANLHLADQQECGNGGRGFRSRDSL